MIAQLLHGRLKSLLISHNFLIFNVRSQKKDGEIFKIGLYKGLILRNNMNYKTNICSYLEYTFFLTSRPDLT